MGIMQEDLTRTQPSPEKEKKSTFATMCQRMGGYILGIIIFYGVIVGIKFLNEHDFLQKEAQVSFKQMAESGIFPEAGEYISVETRFVVAYAEHTSYANIADADVESGKQKYYLVALDDGTVLSVCTANLSEIESLEKFEKLLISGNISQKHLTLTGEVKMLEDSKLLSIYNEALEVTGISGDDRFTVTHLLVDTTKSYYGKYIVYSMIALLVCGIIVSRTLRKKKEQ